MLIAEAKRKTNIIEYILYLYQIEDIIRSFQFNLNAIEQAIIGKYDQSESVKQKIKSWYELLIAKMQNQRIETKGHLKELHDLSGQLQQLHKQLLTSYMNENYIETYEAAKPALKDLVLKAGNENLQNEIDVALHGMYGLLVLRLKQETIGTETEEAMKKVSTFLAHLAHYFKLMENGELEIPINKQN